MSPEEKIEHWLDIEEAPRTHNLTYLTELLDLPENYEYLKIMGQLNAYYIKGRYPTYKRKLSRTLDKKTAQAILDRTQEIFRWLKSQLISPND